MHIALRTLTTAEFGRSLADSADEIEGCVHKILEGRDFDSDLDLIEFTIVGLPAEMGPIRETEGLKRGGKGVSFVRSIAFETIELGGVTIKEDILEIVSNSIKYMKSKKISNEQKIAISDMIKQII